MRSTALSIFMALAPMLAAGNPVPEGFELNARQAGDCVVNRELVETWHESAQTRRRIAVSTEGNAEPDEYCDYWLEGAGGNPRNKQCYIHDTYGHVIDVSFDLGGLGDVAFEKMYQTTLSSWRTKKHCSTG
ncbi:hypothetical protein CC79DRAFT_1326140 [Sarocladium strictum]